MKILIILFCISPLTTFASDSSKELLKKLVEISSGSNDVAGVTQVQQIIADELKSMSFQTELTPSASGKLGPLLIGTLKGKSSQYITFIAHADTVFEKFSGFTTYQISADGKTAKGPGVIDDKGGIVVLLSGLKEYLGKNNFPSYSLRVISSPGEEVGMPELLPLFKKYSRNSVIVLGFEPCLDDGSIIDGRRGNRWYSIKVVGREAHAGRAHKEGVNACWELAKKLDAISKLTDYSKDLTVSIGHIEGGKDKYNIVCGEASAKIDVRFSNIESRDKFHKKFEQIVKRSFVLSVSDKKPTSSSFEITDETEPFSPTPESLRKIKTLKMLIEKYEGRKVSSQKSGGAADTNNFSRSGLPIIDGLGACGGKMHTQDEYIELLTLGSRAKVLSDFLDQL